MRKIQNHPCPCLLSTRCCSTLIWLQLWVCLPQRLPGSSTRWYPANAIHWGKWPWPWNIRITGLICCNLIHHRCNTLRQSNTVLCSGFRPSMSGCRSPLSYRSFQDRTGYLQLHHRNSFGCLCLLLWMTIGLWKTRSRHWMRTRCSKSL